MPERRRASRRLARSLFALALALFVSAALPAAAAPAPQDESEDPFAGGGTLRLAVGNGLTALVVADAKAKDVAVRLEIAGGAAADPGGLEGLSAVALAALLGERSGDYPGGAIEPGPSTTTVRFRVDAKAFGPALGALAARLAGGGTLVTPASLESALGLARERAKSSGAAADRALAALLFGPGHPAARAWAGSADTLGAIRMDDVRTLFAGGIPASRSTLAVAGPIVGVDALAEIPIRCAAWPARKSAAAAASPASAPIPRQGRRAATVPAEGDAHEVRAAFLLPPRSDARLPRAAAAAAVALRSLPGAAPGSLEIRFHGRRADASVLVVAFRVDRPEDAATALAQAEAALAGARAASETGDGPVRGADALPSDLRAAIALLESNPDDDGAVPKAPAKTAAIDLDAWVAVVAGRESARAEAALRSGGFAVEKR